VRTGENTYRISLAVAGFRPEQVNVTVNQNMLVVSATAISRIKVNTFIAASRAVPSNADSISQTMSS
jgi:HSP20 family molecular chaperone IbpA